MVSVLVRALLALDKMVIASWNSGYVPGILNGCLFGLLIALLIIVNKREAEHFRKRELDYAISAKRRENLLPPASEEDTSIRDFICLVILSEELD